MFTGNFKGFFFFSLIIIIHELGHVMVAIFYKWKIVKIILLPFGALTVFHEKINRPLKEEFIILIAGPLVQIIFTLFFISSKEIVNYSNLIIMFNLLPIYPLDGSKLLNIILNKFISFKRSHLITIYISFIVIFFLIIIMSLCIIWVSICFFDNKG